MKQLLIAGFLMISGLVSAQDIQGAWMLHAPDGRQASLIINENYLALALYDLQDKKFGYTEGGTYKLKDKVFTYYCEFNSKNSNQVGKESEWKLSLNGDNLIISGDRGSFEFERIDRSSDHPMSGTWTITERAQGDQGKLVKIHQSGTRKTLKLLSGTRFQWVAIDPAVRSEEHTSELQSRGQIVCRLLHETTKKNTS